MGVLNLTSTGQQPVPIIHGTVRMPRVGVWHADIVVDTQQSVTGPVTLSTPDGSFSLSGTAYRDGVFQNTLSLRIVGGAAGLGLPSAVTPTVGPKSYSNAALRLPLQYILSTCGETLSQTADRGVLNTTLASWMITRGTGKQAVARLFDSIATSWRILPDGSFWCGTDAFPPAPNVQFDVLYRYFGEGRIVLGCDQPFLLPGVALTISASATQGVQNVSYVVHILQPSAVRSEVWFERTAVTS